MWALLPAESGRSLPFVRTEPDALPARMRFYRRDVGPSRWLMAVVSYEQQPARIITALANRKDPKRWKP
jgi:hypothetical protein